MTEPTGGPPSPQPPQSPPPQAPAPAPAGGNWSAPPPTTTAPGGFQTQAVAAEAGPAPGIAYADLTTRVIAFIIDSVIVWLGQVVLLFIGGVFAAAVGAGLLFSLVFGIIWAVLSVGYFVYGWTRMRASPGQKILNLETVNATDGATLNQNQAIRRWLYLYGLYALSGIIPLLGLLILLVAIAYALFLIYTTSQSPKRQGFHDVQAGTVVIKRVGA
jgi:uncharacterized RDD family membrane protein YckC